MPSQTSTRRDRTPVCERDQPLLGHLSPPTRAHLVADRNGYTHHGIYTGNGRVVHYAGLCHGLSSGPIEEVSLAVFARGQAVWVRPHVNPRFDRSQAVERARSRLGEKRYRLTTNNCEHLCEWCLQGESRSRQIEALRAEPRQLLLVMAKAVRLWVRTLVSGQGLVAMAALLAVAGAADAGTTTANLLVSVAVESACTVSANPLSFGSYRPGLGSVSANTTLSVRCTKGVPFTVALDAGSGGGGVAQRQMTFGAYKLRYNLYTSAPRTTVWGDGQIGSAVVAGIGKGLAGSEAISETVYGQLPDSGANQQLAPGLYTDTVRVTVTY